MIGTQKGTIILTTTHITPMNPQAGLLAARFADGRKVLAEPPQNAELGEVGEPQENRVWGLGFRV